MPKDKQTKSARLTPDRVDELVKSAENWTDIRQQIVNVNYYVGNQWIGWNSAQRKVQTLPQQSGEVRITRNKIRPRVTALLAKHIKNRLKFDVTPGSKDQQDIDTARAGDKYLKVLWQELDFSGKTREMFLFMLVQKRCWVKTWFDAEAGPEITPQEGEPGYEGWSQGPQTPVHEGVIRARVCNPLSTFSDPSAKTLEEIRWVAERYPKDVDEIFDEYGKKVSPSANLDFLNQFDITRAAGDGIGAYETTRLQNMAIVTELWHKPCKKYPEGAKITICDGQELDYDEASGELPYELMGYLPIPGSLLYDAIVTDLLPPQREINVLRSMIATHARRMGNAMWLNPNGSGVDEEMMTNEHGGLIDYTPIGGAKPERIQAPDIPSFYSQELANNAIDIDDMGGSREVSQGRLPAGLDTLGGLELMVEQENEKLSIGSQSYEDAMKRVMRRILKLLKAHYTEERQGQLLGEGNEIEIVSFNGSDLTGFEDINIVQGSSLPDMKAAQQERIMLMWNSGAIVKKDGMPDPDKLLRLMGMGDSTELFEEKMLDENNAKMENKTFEDLAENPEFQQAMAIYQQTLQQASAAGMPPDQIMTAIPEPPGIPQIWDSDDDEVHILIHNTFRKTSRYRQMAPGMRMLVDRHYEQHVARLQAPILQQQAAEAAAQDQESENDEKNHAREIEKKQMDHSAAAQRDAMKADTALAAAAMKGDGTQP